MKKKAWVWLAAMALATVCIAAGALMRQPKTLEQLYPQIELETSDAISLLCRVYPGQEDYSAVYQYTLYPGDEGFADLLDLLEGADFRGTLPPLGDTRRHTIADDDVEWVIIVGRQGGWVLDISNYFGDLTIQPAEGEAYYGRAATADWCRKVYEIIAEHGAPSIIG